MTQPFDRETQRRILEIARDFYPEIVDNPVAEFSNVALPEELIRELTYLQEHGLVTFRDAHFTGGRQLRDVRITAKGIDFLVDDGGLGAILGVVTVRLDVAPIQALLVREVEASKEPSSVKAKLVAQIKSLPAEGVKVLATEGLKAGLPHVPGGLQWLQNALHALLS